MSVGPLNVRACVDAREADFADRVLLFSMFFLLPHRLVAEWEIAAFSFTALLAHLIAGVSLLPHASPQLAFVF